MTDCAIKKVTTIRQELEEKIMWNGGGHTIGDIGLQFHHAMDEPGPNKPDLKSIVALGLPRYKYTDEELEQIVMFAERVTSRHDRMFRYRRGANFILLDKRDDGMWLRKRLSWITGAMYSTSLSHAIAIMSEKHP
jgi:hypothetical protein